MKKLLGLGVVLFCLASCSDNDAAPAVNLDNLQKRWYNVSTIVSGKTVAYDGNLACGKDYLEFSAGNVAKDVDVYDCQKDPAVTTGTYTAADKSLTTLLGGETVVYTIEKLNTKTLQIATTFNGGKIAYVYTSTP